MTQAPIIAPRHGMEGVAQTRRNFEPLFVSPFQHHSDYPGPCSANTPWPLSSDHTTAVAGVGGYGGGGGGRDVASVLMLRYW